MKKIIGIFIMTLLIGTALQTVGISNIREDPLIILHNPEPNDPPSSWLKGSDQTQTSDIAYGFLVNPLYHISQEFKPSKPTLTAVAMSFFAINSPPRNTMITVAIRDELEGDDLTTISVNADDWKIKGATWVLFDFEDIEVIPDETYYIVCNADKGIIDYYDINNTYAYFWLFDIGNKYDRGIAYQSNDSAETWHDLENPFDDPDYPEWVEVDFTFITYYQEPQSKMITKPILRFIENHPLINSILQQLLSRIDLPH